MSSVIITKVGLSKIAGATANNPLILEKFAVGDGEGAGEDSTALINEKYRDLINDKYSNNNNLVVECVLRGNSEITEGFYLRELGIFDIEGDLIAIAKLPESYRPPLTEGQILTENIFNVTLKIENTENIQISINENIFATTDEVNRLIATVEGIKNTINSSIGIDKWFNTDNRYKDQNLVKLGSKTWALMDSSNILNISDYPTLFKNLGAVDRGDGTFAMPNFNDGTLRHLNKGNARELGSFESDEIKLHNHGMEHDHDMTHDHDMSHQHIYNKMYIQMGYGNVFRYGDHSLPYSQESTWGGRDRTGGSSRGRTLGSSKPFTDNAGGTETRMKNTGGQWYILAKIDF